MDDTTLLRRYVEARAEDAFAELVRRHVNLVYFAALRQVGGNAALADDVTQAVFTDLARKAARLTNRPTLAGWLHASTRFAAANARRTESRRRAREQAAMQSATNDNETVAADWDRLRPVIDEALHTLDESDREAVLMRFFENRPFGEIGAALRVTEEAARKRVERALDQLAASLAGRGVTSTAAALGIALANQGGATVSSALVTSVAGAALAGAVPMAAGVATAGLAGIGAGKLVAAVAGIAAVLAGGVALIEHRRASDAEAALASTEQQQRTLVAQVAASDARARRAEQRAAEAEKDNEALLKAVEAVKSRPVAPSPPVPPRTSPEVEERLVYERAYQQELARRRAQEATARASVDEAVSRMDDASAYHRLVNVAREQASDAEFQAAIRTLNRAMTLKPAELTVTPEIRQFQADLRAQNTPVEVTLLSDGQTWVSVTNFRAPNKLTNSAVKLLPGNYQIVGRRKGYRDVAILLQVRSGSAPPPVSVFCTKTVPP